MVVVPPVTPLVLVFELVTEFWSLTLLETEFRLLILLVAEFRLLMLLERVFRLLTLLESVFWLLTLLVDRPVLLLVDSPSEPPPTVFVRPPSKFEPMLTIPWSSAGEHLLHLQLESSVWMSSGPATVEVKACG